MCVMGHILVSLLFTALGGHQAPTSFPPNSKEGELRVCGWLKEGGIWLTLVRGYRVPMVKAKVLCASSEILLG